MLNQETKVREDVKLQFRAINSLNNVQDRRYTTIWKMKLSEYFRWSVFFKLTMFAKKNDREKIEKTYETMPHKDREALKLHFSAINSSTNSQNQQENRLCKWEFEHIFDNPSFFFTHNVQRKKRSRKNQENKLNYGAKRQRRS